MTSGVMRFYARTLSGTVPRPAAREEVSAVWWRAGDRAIPPEPLRQRVNYVWSVIHHAGAFANRDFGVLTLMSGPRMLHRSGVFPGFFRFPFMAPDDLQIGDTWTDETARGQGLAGDAIETILADTGHPGRRYWYLVDAENAPSIRVIERAGFQLAGTGAKLPRFGVKALGYYAMTREAVQDRLATTHLTR